jgi:hypothetical protein
MEHVADLRASYNRLKHSVDVYNDTTRNAFTTFVDTAVSLVGIAVTLTTGTPATMLLRGIVGTVGTKLVLLQEQYSAQEFVKDVVSQAGGALGGQVATTMLHKGIPHLSQAARVAGLRLPASITDLATKGLTWAADQVGSTAGSKAAVGGELSLPSLKEWADAAGITLVGKGKATLGQAVKRRPAPVKVVVKASPEPGVRLSMDFPWGGRMRLLDNGRVTFCHSPCDIYGSYGLGIQAQYRLELGGDSRVAEALRREVQGLQAREQTAIQAGDQPAREALFVEAAAISLRLEQLRVSLRTGVHHNTMAVLLQEANSNSALVQEFLRYSRNDANAVYRALRYADGDQMSLNRLRELAGRLEAPPQFSGGLFYHPTGLRPYARRANMPHFLDAHTYMYFKDYGQRPPLSGFWPEGTTREHVEGYLLEAVAVLRDVERWVAPPPPEPWQRQVHLSNGIQVQIGFNGRVIGQFFPIEQPNVPGSTVRGWTVQELDTIGHLLFGRT